MKKLMIAAAIVCAAVVSQAASVTWSSGNLSGWGDGYEGWTTSAGKIGTSSTTATPPYDFKTGLKYLGTLYIYDSATATDAIATFTQATLDKGATKKLESSSDAITYAASTAGGTTYYAKLVVEAFNSTSGDLLSSVESSLVSFTGASDALEAPSINFYSGVGINETKPAGDHGFMSADGWQSVPEPTSGLLLLLGVAGLALKRKRA